MSGYRAGLPAVESVVTTRNKSLLNRQDVLHTVVCAPADKAGSENNTEDEGHGLDGRNENAGHDVSFQTEGFHNTPRFSRGSQMNGQSDPKNRQDHKTHHKPRLDEYSESERDDDKYARDEECAYSRKSPAIHVHP